MRNLIQKSILLVMMTSILYSCSPKKDAISLGGGGSSGSGSGGADQGVQELSLDPDELAPFKTLPVMNDYNAANPAWAAPPASESWSVFSSETQIKPLLTAKLQAEEVTSLNSDWSTLLALYPNGAIPQFQTDVASMQKTFKVKLKLANNTVINPSIPYWVAFANIHVLVSPSGALYLGLQNFNVFNSVDGLMGLKITSAATPTLLVYAGKTTANVFNRSPYRFVLSPFVSQSAPFGLNMPAPATIEKKIDEIIPITQPALTALASAITSLESSYLCASTTYVKPSTGYNVCKVYVPALKKINSKHVLIPYKKIDGKIYRLFAFNTITGGAVARIYMNDPVIKNAILSTHPWLTY